MFTIAAAEVVLTGTAFSILVIYHLHLACQVRKDPMATSIGLGNHLRYEWVEAVMGAKEHIEAIQTLRNWVMASSFLASTAILIGLGILNTVFRTEKIAECAHALNLFGTKSLELWLIKLMILVVVFFFSFFNFALTIRYYNHASFAINIPTSDEPAITYESVAKIINRANMHYTLGMRGFYFSVPLTLWLFGPTWMLSGSIVLTVILYKLDRTI
ncbi:MAG: DUF599 domain-containing protein [Deltaproteobacteria bacterium]|nr:DUF599 domain-containing protein [Deltaproteobacteria bacterium]